jgi:hypothetical protein
MGFTGNAFVEIASLQAFPVQPSRFECRITRRKEKYYVP